MAMLQGLVVASSLWMATWRLDAFFAFTDHLEN